MEFEKTPEIKSINYMKKVKLRSSLHDFSEGILWNSRKLLK